MAHFSRRRFIHTSLIGSALYTGKALAFDLDGMLEKASPYIEKAQPLVQSMMFSEADEITMGENYYPEYIKKGGGLHSDEKIQEALKTFSNPFLETTARKNLNWEIVLLNSEEVNAWALPGGKLAVNAGLLPYTRTPEELASVIAHEIGHVELSHGVSQMKTKTFMGSLSGIGKQVVLDYFGSGASGALSSEVLNALEGPLFDLINKGYSRQHEFEADAHILSVFNKTGMDQHKADDFFVTLDKLYPSNTDITTSLFSTHPITRDRIQKLEELAAQQKMKPKKASIPGWNILKEAFPDAKAG